MEQTQAIADATISVVKCLVKAPELVSLRVIEDATGVVVRVVVPPEELGAVIGKQGRTARSLRILLRAMSMKSNRQMSLDICPSSEQPL